MNAARRLCWLMLATALTACDLPYLGGGEPPPPKTNDPLNLDGTNLPAPMRTPENVARAAVAVTRVVDLTAEVSDSVGDALKDLFPEEDNPCPGGGRASREVSGSLSRPRITMSFGECLRGEVQLSGMVQLTCEDFDGSNCTRGELRYGDGDPASVLQHRRGAFGSGQVIVLRGIATVTRDDNARVLDVAATLNGETFVDAAGARYSFVTENLRVNLQDLPDGTQQMRLEGVTAIGGINPDAADCLTGRFDVETLDALGVAERRIRAGALRLHSPPPRPAAQQGAALFDTEAADMTGANGETRRFTPAELDGYCKV